ncbi:MAG: phosphotransferase enzyme family protein [Hyphomicrobiales bacterium]
MPGSTGGPRLLVGSNPHFPDGPAERLHGNVSEVVRIGDTVRRSTGRWTPAVHALLRHLEACGFGAAPHVRGIDAEGREVLSYIEGEVQHEPGPWITESILRGVGVLLRELHEATRGFALPDGVAWAHRSPRGTRRATAVICHNDVAPRNLIVRDGRPAAFLDWDFASPASPLWDVAHACWEFVPLADDARCERIGWSPLPARPERARVLADGYGLRAAERRRLPGVIVRRMAATADGMEFLAAGGDRAMQRLVDRGFPAQIRREIAWVEANRDALAAALA